MVGVPEWSAQPGEARAIAWRLRSQGWTHLAHRHVGDNGVEYQFLRGWINARGETRTIGNLPALLAGDQAPDLLVAFVAARDDYAARCVDLVTARGWPPVLLHAAPELYGWAGPLRPHPVGAR